ncbi:MAG: hypothetical protein ABFR82_10845 [Nitrospirota bacterium]
MAKSIKETPTLIGKDAQRFSEKMKKNEKRRVTSAEYNRVKSNYNKVKLQVKS